MEADDKQTNSAGYSAELKPGAYVTAAAASSASPNSPDNFLLETIIIPITTCGMYTNGKNLYKKLIIGKIEEPERKWKGIQGAA